MERGLYEAPPVSVAKDWNVCMYVCTVQGPLGFA